MTSVTPKQRKDRETKIDKNIFRAIKNDASLINYICLKLFMNTPEFTAQKRKFYISKCEHCYFAHIY